MPNSSTWASDVIKALVILGGKAHLSLIYAKVQEMRKSRGDTLGQFEAWIRHALQSNSRGKGLDCFVHLGRPRSGMWAFKKLVG
jgi:hypothetical protein